MLIACEKYLKSCRIKLVLLIRKYKTIWNIFIITNRFSEFKKYRGMLVECINRYYQTLHELYAMPDDPRLYFDRKVFTIGILIRSINLFEGILRGFTEINIVSINCLFRAYIETLGVIHYYIETPDYVEKAIFGAKNNPKMQSINILTAIEHADKDIKGLENLYKYYCERTHPNAASLYVNAEKKGDSLIFNPFPSKLGIKQGESLLFHFADKSNQISSALEQLFEAIKTLIKMKNRAAHL